jgi:UDP-N-acetyl-2-amino-2-deoxyglucuronate dehydrogenase
MKNFGLIGAAGYIAPRHMKAISETGNSLVAALDTNDSVGIIDSYFPDADFFTEFERFDRHIEKLRRESPELNLDYVSICSPNYLHDAHSRFALRVQADAICEKPMVLNPWNITSLQEIEAETGRRIWTILQLRLHPSIRELKNKVEYELKQNPNRVYELDLTYITSRGHWYQISWKGDESKSGGIATNIGVHFFDMLTYIFGPVQRNVVHKRDQNSAAGFLELKNARVRWFLSIDTNHIPEHVRAKGMRTFRSMTIEGEEIEFSKGFTDLHTESYKEIIAGRGFGLEESIASIQIVHDIREADISKDGSNEMHPFVLKV